MRILPFRRENIARYATETKDICDFESMKKIIELNFLHIRLKNKVNLHHPSDSYYDHVAQ